MTDMLPAVSALIGERNRARRTAVALEQMLAEVQAEAEVARAQIGAAVDALVLIDCNDGGDHDGEGWSPTCSPCLALRYLGGTLPPPRKVVDVATGGRL